MVANWWCELSVSRSDKVAKCQVAKRPATSCIVSLYRDTYRIVTWEMIHSPTYNPHQDLKRVQLVIILNSMVEITT